MIEIIVSNLPSDAIKLGIRWRKKDGLLYLSAVALDTKSSPEKLVSSLRELADTVEREVNRC